MNASILYHCFGIYKEWFCKKIGYEEKGTQIHLEARREEIICPHCYSLKIILRGSRKRMIKGLPIGKRPTQIDVEVPRCQCSKCWKFFDFSPSFVGKGKSCSRKLEILVADLCKKMSMTDVAAHLCLKWDTVKRIFEADLLKESRSMSLRGVKYLGIDEVYLGKLHKFITVVIDWETGRVLHVDKGRGKNGLQKFFRRLRKAKAKVQAVATDMGLAYVSAVRKHLPHAALVIDRFHVVKLVNEKIDDLRRALQKEADVMGRAAIKGTRYLLLRGKENLTEEQIPKLEEALKLNHPLSQGYYLKEELRRLWLHPDRSSMTAFFDQWLQRARETKIPIFLSLANTLFNFRSAILNWAEHPISNGRLEGLNNKIGAIQRSHYGLRDFAFFRLRILCLHRAKHTFCG